MRRLLATATLVALALAACSRGSTPPSGQSTTQQTPPAWTPAVQPIDLPAGASSSEPRLTASPAGLVLSWIERTGDATTLKFAERTSNAWSATRTAASGRNWFVSWADVPSVLRLSNGTLVANWFTNTNVQNEGYDLWLAYSRDEGATWSKPFRPHHDGTQTQHGFTSMFETPDKGLGLVWLDAREYELNKDAADGGSVMLRYAAYDSSWKQTADAMVNDRVCECCQTSAVSTPDGIVVAFRDRTQDEIRDIHVTRLQNGEWSDPTPVHDDHWEIDSCPVNGPAISAHGRQLATAWFTAAGGSQGQAFAAFSNDAGRTWGAPIRLDGGRSLGHVGIEMLDDGSAVASWVEFSNQRAHLRIRRVEPSGQLSAPIDIAGTTGGRVSGYPRMARQGNELLLAWTESAGDSGDDEDAAQQVKGAVVRLR
jgi:hypothetical protein